MKWNPELYERFQAQRGQPARDLLARIEHPGPALVVDLGCGTARGTADLAARWPGARVIGLDSSAEMLTSAAPAPNVELVQGDIAHWTPPGPVDVLFSNAALHWVPDHDALLTRLAGQLAPGGVMAVQVPDNTPNPSHASLFALARSPRWRMALGELPEAWPVRPLPHTLDHLAGLGLEAEGWETTYLHHMPGAEAILNWVRGTTLNPYLARLSPAEADDFLAELLAAYEEAYPTNFHGVWFGFRRLFWLARRPLA